MEEMVKVQAYGDIRVKNKIQKIVQKDLYEKIYLKNQMIKK